MRHLLSTKVENVKKFLGVTALTSAVLLMGCGSSKSNEVGPTSVADATTTSVQVTTPTQEANTFPLIGGGSIDLSRGPMTKPMALWFWAPG